VVVFLASFVGGLLAPLLFATSAEVLDRLETGLPLLRAGNLLVVVTSVAIVVLASLLYLALHDAAGPLALVALGWWLVEAVLLAVSAIAVQALLAAAAAAPDGDVAPQLAALLVAVQGAAVTLHMLFFCLGALVWYGLMLRTRLVPAWLAAWGLAGVVLMLVDTVLLVFDPALGLGPVMYALYVPYELVIGLWLLVRGAPAFRPAEA
jgi:hypothetical protein